LFSHPNTAPGCDFASISEKKMKKLSKKKLSPSRGSLWKNYMVLEEVLTKAQRRRDQTTQPKKQIPTKYSFSHVKYYA